MANSRKTVIGEISGRAWFLLRSSTLHSREGRLNGRHLRDSFPGVDSERPRRREFPFHVFQERGVARVPSSFVNHPNDSFRRRAIDATDHAAPVIENHDALL